MLVVLDESKKDILCFTGFLPFLYTSYSNFLGYLILTWILRWSFLFYFIFSVFAQDPIVLDLTMQYIFCPWLCQAPWRLRSTICLLLWTSEQCRKPRNAFFTSLMYLLVLTFRNIKEIKTKVLQYNLTFGGEKIRW